MDFRVASDIRGIIPVCNPRLIKEPINEFWSRFKLSPMFIPNYLKDMKGFRLINYTSYLWAVETKRHEIKAFTGLDKKAWDSQRDHKYSITILDDDNHLKPVASRISDSFEEAMLWHFGALRHLLENNYSAP